MKKNLIYILFLIIGLFLLSGCNEDKKDTGNKLTVAVSIVPEKTFVKEIAGDLVDVLTLIPPGGSHETYSPTPKDLTGFSNATLYFSIGLPIEKGNVFGKIKDLNKTIKIIKLENEVKKVYPEREVEPGERDLHIWLSPKRVKVMVEAIARELISADPANKDTYTRNSIKYIAKLNKLDNKIKNILKKIKIKTFIIYHPAFGYFADDYGLTMLAIEKEGKEATAQDLGNLFDTAKKENIRVIFYQEEMDKRQAESFAESIKGKTLALQPLAPDYLSNMEKIARIFAEAYKN